MNVTSVISPVSAILDQYISRHSERRATDRRKRRLPVIYDRRDNERRLRELEQLEHRHQALAQWKELSRVLIHAVEAVQESLVDRQFPADIHLSNVFQLELKESYVDVISLVVSPVSVGNVTAFMRREESAGHLLVIGSRMEFKCLLCAQRLEVSEVIRNAEGVAHRLQYTLGFGEVDEENTAHMLQEFIGQVFA
ncbi:MAG: hypothetical protein HQL51_16440 [Magnetococcales bacterium]|nr:hypothetical protein [Magnetococcales bacterium]